MRIRVLLVVSLLLALLIPTGPAHAAWVTYQSSPNDRFNATDVKPEYDVVSIDIGISDTTPNEIYFFLEFSQPISNSQFADGKGSWASVMLDMDNDGKEDFSMDSSAQSYVNNFYHTAKFTNRQGVVPMSDSRCMAITWTDLVNDAKWIAFRIQKTCLNFTKTFGVRGYADFNSSDNATSDWAPDEFWKVNLAGGVIPTATPTSTATTNTTAVALIDARNAASDAKNAAEEAFDSFTESKDECVNTSLSFDNEFAQELYDSTDLSIYCDQLDLDAASVQRKIAALDPQTARTTDAANKETDAANKLAENADVLTAKMQDIVDELAGTEGIFSSLQEELYFFQEFESSFLGLTEVLRERIGILPTSLQLNLKKSSEYKSILAFEKQLQTVINSKDTIMNIVESIKRPSQVMPSLNSLISLKNQLPPLTSFKKNVTLINKKIPAVVCQKGSLVVSASKTGKCAKGFESIATK